MSKHVRKYTTEELLGRAPAYPSVPDDEADSERWAAFSRAKDDFYAFEEQRRVLDDEIAAARVFARQGSPLPTEWRGKDDPRCVAWLSVHKAGVKRTVAEISEANVSDDYEALVELGSALSKAAGLCVVVPRDAKFVRVVRGDDGIPVSIEGQE